MQQHRNSNSVMESDTIQKNEAIPKSLSRGSLKIFIILTFIVSAFGMASCEKDSSGNISDLYGTWVSTQIQGNGESLTFNISDESSKMTFHKNGAVYDEYNEKWTWNYKNEVLTMIHFAGAISYNYNVITLNPNIMILEFINIIYIFRKI